LWEIIDVEKQALKDSDTLPAQIEEPLKYLIMGSSDARHIIKTVSRAWRNSALSKPVNVQF
jgi:hypothetical protein